MVWGPTTGVLFAKIVQLDSCGLDELSHWSRIFCAGEAGNANEGKPGGGASLPKRTVPQHDLVAQHQAQQLGATFKAAGQRGGREQPVADRIVDRPDRLFHRAVDRYLDQKVRALASEVGGDDVDRHEMNEIGSVQGARDVAGRRIAELLDQSGHVRNPHPAPFRAVGEGERDRHLALSAFIIRLPDEPRVPTGRARREAGGTSLRSLSRATRPAPREISTPCRRAARGKGRSLAPGTGSSSFAASIRASRITVQAIIRP